MQVIAATHIAETSVTIEGTVYVIDCMFSKQKVRSLRYASKESAESCCLVKQTVCLHRSTASTEAGGRQQDSSNNLGVIQADEL